MSDDYFEHPLIKKNRLEKRIYQETIFHTTVRNNTLVVLPTGMGKTVSAVLLAAHRLNKKGGKVLFMAPTRPLVEQHKRFFDKFLEIEGEDMKVLTGRIRPGKRKKEYERGMCFFATPQVIQNDIIAGRIDLSKFTVLIFDECHRATGDYPYSFIAEMYMRRAKDPRILGITASPGGSEKDIKRVVENLFIDEVEIRTEKDSDVKDYVQNIDKQWRKVDLPEEFREVKGLLEEAYSERIKKLKNWGYAPTGKVYRKELLKMQGRLRKKISKGEGDKMLYAALSKSAEAMKIEHGMMLLETQGSSSLYKYFKRLREEARQGKTKAAKSVMKDGRIATAFRKTSSLLDKGIEHPKLDELKKIVEGQIKEKKGSKILVFSHYRDQVDKIKEELEDIEGCKPGEFIGQAGEKGMSQKEQVERLEKLEEGIFNTIVATTVGEEGLDIPAVDLVVFYEPVASEIRTIQRRGRTGREKSGKVIVLIAKDTRDEAYYWKSKHRERRMKETLKEMKNSGGKQQRDLDEF